MEPLTQQFAPAQITPLSTWIVHFGSQGGYYQITKNSFSRQSSIEELSKKVSEISRLIIVRARVEIALTLKFSDPCNLSVNLDYGTIGAVLWVSQRSSFTTKQFIEIMKYLNVSDEVSDTDLHKNLTRFDHMPDHLSILYKKESKQKETESS